MRALRIFVVSAAVALVIDCGIAYVWLLWGPYPENAFDIFGAA